LGVKLTTLSPSSAKVKFQWSYTSTHSICLMAWTGTTLLSLY
jgi:hypothetical protein